MHSGAMINVVEVAPELAAADATANTECALGSLVRVNESTTGEFVTASLAWWRRRRLSGEADACLSQSDHDGQTVVHGDDQPGHTNATVIAGNHARLSVDYDNTAATQRHHLIDLTGHVDRI